MFQVAEPGAPGSGKESSGQGQESHVCWGRFPAQRVMGCRRISPPHPGTQEPRNQAPWPGSHVGLVSPPQRREVRRGPGPMSSDGHHLGVRGVLPEPPGSQAQSSAREADKLLSHLPRLLPPTKCRSHSSSGEGLDLFPSVSSLECLFYSQL